MGFKTLTIFLVILAFIGGPHLVYSADEAPPATPAPAAGEAEEGVGDNSVQAEKLKTTLTPEEEAALIAEKKAGVESSINTVFNRIGTTDPNVYVGRVISGAMGILGSITLVMFIYSGFLWMTAAGDAGKSEKARDILVWSSLGLLVIFSSYAILRFVFDIFLI